MEDTEGIKSEEETNWVKGVDADEVAQCIQLAEDDPDVGAMLETSLIRFGLPIKMAITGSKAIDNLLQFGSERTAVVVTDLHMPHDNTNAGSELLPHGNAIARRAIRSGIPVIVHTAEASAVDADIHGSPDVIVIGKSAVSHMDVRRAVRKILEEKGLIK